LRLVAEVRGAAHVAPLLSGALVWQLTKARGRFGAGLGALAAAGVVDQLVRAQARVERETRSAQDAAVLAARLGTAAPLFGLWAAEADLAAIVVRELEYRVPELVVECGSGVTTLVIADQLRRLGRGRLISLEHDEGFAATIRGRLDEANLAEWVTVVDLPLQQTTVRGTTVDWYSQAAVAQAVDAPIDLLFIDGPPQRSRWARWAGLELLYDSLSPQAVVIADDGRTSTVRAAANRWVADHADLELYWIDTVKGTWMVRRSNHARGALFRLALDVRRRMNPHPTGFGRWPVRR
jgi:predicted O-methyltransferase YrrM